MLIAVDPVSLIAVWRNLAATSGVRTPSRSSSSTSTRIFMRAPPSRPIHGAGSAPRRPNEFGVVPSRPMLAPALLAASTGTYGPFRRRRTSRDPAQDRLRELPFRPLERRVAERALFQRRDFVRGVGVVLGRSPDHVEKKAGFDRPDLACRDPFPHHAFAREHPLRQLGVEKILDRRRAAHDFAGPDLRAERHGARKVHFRADVGGQRLGRIVAGVEGRSGLQPDVQHALGDGAIEPLLGGKVVVDIGFGQAGAGRDFGHCRAAETSLGEHRLGRREDRSLVLLTYARPGDRRVHRRLRGRLKVRRSA